MSIIYNGCRNPLRKKYTICDTHIIVAQYISDRRPYSKAVLTYSRNRVLSLLAPVDKHHNSKSFISINQYTNWRVILTGKH